jgi:hypothetical protein
MCESSDLLPLFLRDTCPTVGSDAAIHDVKEQDVGAAGGRGVIPPYPAASELSGICRIMRTRDC